MLPSSRMRAPDRSRVRQRTVRIFRCRDCHVDFDSKPVRIEHGVRQYGRCPNLACGASSVFETRIPD